MTRTSVEMYYMALDKAMQEGPKALNIGGTMTAVYALRKDSLMALFGHNGYSIRRRTWIRNVQDWQFFFNAIVPAEIEDPSNTKCHVIFTHITVNELVTLKMFAEDHSVVKVFPPEATA